jgi:hypothetical protein
MTLMEELNLEGNPLALSPDVSAMNHLLNLNLQRTGISQWPIGAEHLTQLHSLMLQENQITSVPEVLFSNPEMRQANRGTDLHDNPLDEVSRQRLSAYRQRINMALGGALPGISHVPLSPDDLNQWLEGVPTADHSQRRTVWEQLKNHEGANPDDAFRVIRDLTLAHDYTRSTATRKTLTARVWRLLQAMAESHELRESIFLNTYVAGTCGDGAILTFIDMELRHKQHMAKAQPSSNQANRELLALAKGMFYLRSLDQLADDHLQRLRNQGLDPDDAEVKLYLRLQLAREFDLPVLQEQRLYNPGDDLTAQDLARIRKAMLDLRSTSAADNALLTEEFWIQYLAHNVPEPFITIEDNTRYKLEVLKQEIPDTRSEDYQERRQSITEEKEAELNRLISQLTRAAQAGAQRVEGVQTD